MNMDSIPTNDHEFLPPLMPDLRLEVVASPKGGEVLILDENRPYKVSLKGRVWKLFDLLVNAQLGSSNAAPHAGFRSTDALRRALSVTPDDHRYIGRHRAASGWLSPEDVARRVNLLRNKLAEARFGVCEVGRSAGGGANG